MENSDVPSETEVRRQRDESDSRIALRRSERLGLFVTSLPKWLAIAVIAWQAGVSIQALASKDALASLLIERFGREVSYWEVVCWIAGIFGIFLGLYNRRLLRRQSKIDSGRLIALERRLNLTPGQATMGTSH